MPILPHFEAKNLDFAPTGCYNALHRVGENWIYVLQNEVFRQYLQEEFIRRIDTNPRFSVRAFARQLGIESSSLSKILRGTRPLTNKMCRRLAKNLNLPPETWNNLFSKDANECSSRRRILDIEIFRIISDWYHFALLELISTKDFKPEPKWISSTLGISVNEVNIAIERLQRFDFLIIDENGKWNDGLGAAEISNSELTHNAMKILQKQILQKAIEAIDDVPYEHRAQYSMTMAINKSDLPEAKKRIKKFVHDLQQDLQKNSEVNEVYNMSASLYPVSKNLEINK